MRRDARIVHAMDDRSDPLRDAEQTAKDRSYSPGSERETAAKQDKPAGRGLLPGTGGPDDPGDIPAPDDGLDAATIAERGAGPRREGEGEGHESEGR